MTDAHDAWISADGEKPTQPGWYAALVCWDPREGVFPTARYWTGKGWKASPDARRYDLGNVSWLPGVCETDDEAQSRAEAHDPDL